MNLNYDRSYDKGQNFINLIESFLSNEITALEFERLFLDFSHISTSAMPDNVYEIVEDLFYYVDAFCSDPELIGEKDIDEEKLREVCKIALNEFRKISGSKMVGTEYHFRTVSP